MARAESTHLFAELRSVRLEELDWFWIRSPSLHRHGRLMIVRVLWKRMRRATRQDSVSGSRDGLATLKGGLTPSFHSKSFLSNPSILLCMSDHLILRIPGW